MNTRTRSGNTQTAKSSNTQATKADKQKSQGATRRSTRNQPPPGPSAQPSSGPSIDPAPAAQVSQPNTFQVPYSAIPTPTEAGIGIDVNYVYFGDDKRIIRVVTMPSNIFQSKAQKVEPFIVKELMDNEFLFEKDRNVISFWKPRATASIPIDLPPGFDWEEREDNRDEYFVEIPLPRSFEAALDNIDDQDIVHLVIIPREGVVPRTEHSESADVLTPLKRYRKILATPGLPPSEASRSARYRQAQSCVEEAIHDGRYPEQTATVPSSRVSPVDSTVAPPVDIYHPIFKSFYDHLNSVRPSKVFVRAVYSFMCYLSTISAGTELDRNRKILAHLSVILNADIHERPNANLTRPDGMWVSFEGTMIAPGLIVELKRELGNGKSDPSTQVALSMRRTWHGVDFATVRDRCCCPTFLIAGGGAWFSVLGGVFPDKVVVQRLTHMLWTANSSTVEEPRAYEFAKVLLALRKSLTELDSYYKNDLHSIPTEVGSDHPRFFPYPTSYKEERQKLVRFKYVDYMERDPECVTFKAMIEKGEDSEGKSVKGKMIIVKFVTRYGADAHHFLAKEGHAPELRYFGSLDGCHPYPSDPPPSHSTEAHPSIYPASPPTHPPGWIAEAPMKMVVMDFVKSTTKVPKGWEEQLRAILTKLHNEGYVFGDLRFQNILFTKEGKVLLIDFDWVGKNRGEDDPLEVVNALADDKLVEEDPNNPYAPVPCYPLNINEDGVKWAQGVKGLRPILRTHDDEMLSTLIEYIKGLKHSPKS